ncbi:DUF5665 domain-containing protein [Romboutsia sp.]|uniref:DUF5665 domain-containing protein n=1 Tax=Romboutsia sp. TaxID=1965302 RepID=UPI003F3795C4
MKNIKHTEHNNLNDQNPLNMKELDEAMNRFELSKETTEDLGTIRRYLERLILIIERSRIRDYMMLTDSKRRLFTINLVAGLGKGFGQAIGFTFLAAIAIYLLTSWMNLPIIGEYIAKIMDIVDNYRKGK